MNERSSRGPGRRVGRERVLEAAIAMIEQADLADVLSFLGTRAVADAADVQPATVRHHFGNREEHAKPNARLAAAVLQACLQQAQEPSTLDEVETIVRETLDVGQLGLLRELAAADLEHFLGNRALSVATLVGAAAAANDPVARDVLGQTYEHLLGDYASMFATVADQLDRRFDTDAGFTAETLAVFCAALVDGLALRHQFDPERVQPALFGELVLRLFETVTLRSDATAADDLVIELLLQRSDGDRLPDVADLDPIERGRIVEVARRTFEARGVAAVSVAAVAKEAGVTRGTVLANFGGRSGLAAAVWAEYLPPIEQRLLADRARGLPLVRIVERHLHRIVEVSRNAPELTQLMLDGVVEQTVRHEVVPVAGLMAPVLLASSDELRGGVADTPEQATELASTMAYLAMVRALVHAAEPVSETVQYVMDLFFDGIVARRNDGR